MRFDKLIYDVREALNEYTDDSSISNRYIEYLYQVKRAKYIRQDLDNTNRSVDSNLIQTFCAPLELVSTDVCGFNTGCDTILRTKFKIPTTIALSTKQSLTSIRPATMLDRPFNFIDRQRFDNIKGSPFKNSLYSFLDGGYIYVYSANEDFKHLECVQISGVFADPLELEKFPKCCKCDANDDPCFDRATMDYPIQPRFVDVIREEIVQTLIRKKQIPEDNENDSTNIITNTPQIENRNKEA